MSATSVRSDKAKQRNWPAWRAINGDAWTTLYTHLTRTLKGPVWRVAPSCFPRVCGRNGDNDSGRRKMFWEKHMEQREREREGRRGIEREREREDNPLSSSARMPYNVRRLSYIREKHHGSACYKAGDIEDGNREVQCGGKSWNIVICTGVTRFSRAMIHRRTN